MKKIIITGGLGFIGSHLVRLFLKKFKVLNIDKDGYASIKSLDFKNDKNYKFVHQDLSNFKKIKEIITSYKPDYIINCAAESHVDNSITNPGVFIKSNIIGTFNILESLKFLKKKIRFLQVSTDEVFGSLKLKEKKFSENTRYDPQSPYSSSKASADHLVRSYGNTYGLDYVITNCSNNFGPYQNPEKFIPKIILSCIFKRKIPVYGNGLNIREWIYVEDHCEGIKLCLERGKSTNTYLIGSNNEIKNIEIVKKICNLFNKKEKFDYHKLIKYVEDRKGHDFRYSINFSKIKKELNFKNKNSFNEGLIKTVNFYSKNVKNLNKIFKSI